MSNDNRTSLVCPLEGEEAARAIIRRAHETDPELAEVDLTAGLADVHRRARLAGAEPKETVTLSAILQFEREGVAPDQVSLAERLNHTDKQIDKTVGELKRKGLVDRRKGNISLREQGRTVASAVNSFAEEEESPNAEPERTPRPSHGDAVPSRLADLRNSVISGWHRRLADNKSPRRNHWQTKVVYYEAAADLLAGRPGQPLTWKSIVAAARPRGCRSTFYEVAGAHARHRMVDDLIADGRPDAVQIALRYLRTDPVEQLIDETKVWSFWSHRQQLLGRRLTEETTRKEMEAALVDALTTWAGANPALAAAVGHTPPACAVEDLTVIHEGQLGGMRAAGRLTDVLRHADLR